ncbi:MAG: HAMP domain-containing protein [Phycisphaerae bacterium]|nr:HAMP domain-containing protein [Gemmatimonadaceae bacterium]
MKLTRRLAANNTLVVGVVLVVTFGILSARNPTIPTLDFVLAAAVAFGVSILLGVLLARSVARPIADLRDSARAIALGNLSKRPALLADGEVGDLADALRRLAEQSEAQSEALKAEEVLLVALTESLNEGVIAVNARHQVVRINDTARELLRLTDPVPFSSDFLPRDRALREALATALDGTDAEASEARVNEDFLSVTARPLADGGAVLALYNLTPFRKLEAVRRDFVANVSHELRTPLTVISGFVDTLQDEQLPPELRVQFLGMAASNVQRMQRIVDDLLDLSRIESGGWLPNASEVDVRNIATEILLPLRKAAAAKGVSLDIHIGDNTEYVYADSTAARQILSNLAENALRHTVQGSVQVFTTRDGDGVWLGVRDSGSGIGPEHLERIFERFYRADPSRSREAGGTGLGLSIVKHLTEAHGGRVRAESVVEKGTEIAAWFPRDTSRLMIG